MRVLTVNAGSSTLKLRVIDPDDEVEASLDVDPWDGSAQPEALPAWLEDLGDVDAVGHRVVHGGDHLSTAVRIDDEVLAAIVDLTSLAPLHQPRSVAGIEMIRSVLPATPTVACFDTAFHARMPEAAATYALPASWRQRWPLRRYGFHGLSHAWAARRSAELVRHPVEDLRVVSCHLGAGASLCAIQAGCSVDTTMGFTPLDGLVMATRSGSVDPGLVLWLLGEGGLGVGEVAHGLEHEAGLAGLAGGSGDMREIVAGVGRLDRDACLAYSVYVHRLRREIAAMAAALDGVDVLVFTGGIGEHQPTVRASGVAGLGFLGFAIDPVRNATAADDADVTAAGNTASCCVVTSREDLEIARNTREALT